MRMLLSILIPVYNEAENISKVLDGIDSKVKGIPYEIDVIYDMDRDTTIPVIKKIRKNYSFNLRLVKNKYGSGVLNAIKTGFETARGEAVVFTTADVSDDPADIKKMYELIEAGYDLVSASRHMRGGRQKSRAVFKKYMSKFIGESLHYLTGIDTHDVTNNFKMYRKSMLNEIEIESSGGFEVGMEITVKAFAAGKKITEIPTVWNDRTAGKSRFKVAGWAPNYFRWYMYALTHRPKKK